MTAAQTFPHLFCCTPGFQIDGNYGITAGFAEMLLQNTPNGIYLLPALPDSWKKGSVKGLRAKGRISADISWDGKYVTAVIYADTESTLDVRCRCGKEKTINVKAGLNQYTSP